MIVATHCNEGKRRNDITTLKLDLQDYILKNGGTNRFEKILTSNNRKVLLHGVLEVSMKSKKDILGTESDFYRCYLFQDLILMVPDIVQIDKEKFSQKCELIYLCFTKISSGNDTRKGKNFLLQAFVKNSLYTFEFVANTERNAKEWAKTIESQIEKQQNGVDERFKKLPLKRIETKEKFMTIETHLNNAESEFLDGRKKVWSNERYLRENLFEISILEEEIETLTKEKLNIMKKVNDLTNQINEYRLSFHEYDEILKEIDVTLFRFLNSDLPIFYEVFGEYPWNQKIDTREKEDKEVKKENRKLDFLSLFNPEKKKRQSASATISIEKDKDIERELMTNNRKSIILSNDMLKKHSFGDLYDFDSPKGGSLRNSFSPSIIPKDKFPPEEKEPKNLGSLIGSIKRKNQLHDHEITKKSSMILSTPKESPIIDFKTDKNLEFTLMNEFTKLDENVDQIKKNILDALPNDPVKLEEILQFVKKL